MKNTESELFDDYINYKRQTVYFQELRSTKPYLNELKPTPERLKLFRDMIDWCEEKNIPPKQWLYTLFAARRWRFPPKLDKNHLQSKKHLERFQKFHNWDGYRASQVQQDNPNQYDPNRDISNAVEQLKTRFLESGEESICLENMFTSTYGFHPLSEVCKGCNIKERCLAKLKESVNYDVVALREGKISAEDAKQQALAGVLRYDRG